MDCEWKSETNFKKEKKPSASRQSAPCWYFNKLEVSYPHSDQSQLWWSVVTFQAAACALAQGMTWLRRWALGWHKAVWRRSINQDKMFVCSVLTSSVWVQRSLLNTSSISSLRMTGASEVSKCEVFLSKANYFKCFYSRHQINAMSVVWSQGTFLRNPSFCLIATFSCFAEVVFFALCNRWVQTIKFDTLRFPGW